MRAPGNLFSTCICTSWEGGACSGRPVSRSTSPLRPVLESTKPMRGNKGSNQGRQERAEESRGCWGPPERGCPVVDHPDLSSGFGWANRPEGQRSEIAARWGAMRRSKAHPSSGLTCRQARSWFLGQPAETPCFDMPGPRGTAWAWTLLILSREWVCLGSSVAGAGSRPRKEE